MSDDRGTLRLYDPANKYLFDFGTVTNISEQFQKSCSVTPIVTKPKQSAFPLETRTYKQIDVSFIRKQPTVIDDNGTYSPKWSNAEWTRRIMQSLDRWQARTDGYQLSYIPSSDNPYIAPIRGEDGSSYETGYIKSLSVKAVKGRPESIQGSFSFHVGTMYIKTSSSSASGGYPRKDFSIAISDADGSNDRLILRLTEDSEISLVDSCKITGGPEAPFEYAQISIPRKSLANIYPDLATSAQLTEKVKAGCNRLTISLAGTSSMTVTKVKMSRDTITLTAYCDAERLKGYSLDYASTMSPEAWISHILTSGRYGVTFDSDHIISYYSAPTPEIRYQAIENLGLKFEKGTNIWFILQVAAMVCGARVFFAKNNAYIVDFRSGRLASVAIDLYNSTTYAGAVVNNVDLNDEGMDTVANTVKIRCLTPTVENKRYKTDGGNIATETYDHVAEDNYSIERYKGQRDAGAVNLATLIQNDPDVEVEYMGQPAKKDDKEGSGDGSTEEGGEETDPGTVDDGVTTFYRQAERFGDNYLSYISEAQQTVQFTMRELTGTGAGSWKPFFEPAATASSITDDPDDIYVNNISVCTGNAKPQKLALKTFTRNYPECTTEYTWGVLASMDLASSTSRIVSTQNTTL